MLTCDLLIELRYNEKRDLRKIMIRISILKLIKCIYIRIVHLAHYISTLHYRVKLKMMKKVKWYTYVPYMQEKLCQHAT